ncbi:P1 family peptidase [Sporolactobacillus terrae]|uniref:DmpA family aminopeptidase n=1 Tax=Sporolactobacillus terrae TaxID=269673 RepID=UPI00048A98BF|nr:P1 family peptidase [Sporolactobacillus terrae]
MGLNKSLYDELSVGMKGPLNLITDVPGVTVGHSTIKTEQINTGVTAILPQTSNLFQSKLPAAAHIINGFGKSVGLIQINELGSLETPILLTNTFAVGTAMNALIKYMLNQNADIGDTTCTVNPLVLECNDGTINDIRAMAIQELHVNQAIASVEHTFAEGAIGAGTGMCCYGLKGGIGSASRQVVIDGLPFTIGSLVLSNFGSLRDLNIYGCPIGAKLHPFFKENEEVEKGSILVILATDLPLDHRQLTRLCKRSSVGISRTGAFIGNGSGEIALAFSTANRIPHASTTMLTTHVSLHESVMDSLFRATASVVEESVLSSLIHADATVDRQGRPIHSFCDAMKALQAEQPDAQVAFLMDKLGLSIT